MLKWSVNTIDKGWQEYRAQFCSVQKDGSLLLEDLEPNGSRIITEAFSEYEWKEYSWGLGRTHPSTRYQNTKLCALLSYIEAQREKSELKENMQVQDLPSDITVQSRFYQERDELQVDIFRMHSDEAITLHTTLEGLVALGKIFKQKSFRLVANSKKLCLENKDGASVTILEYTLIDNA